MEQLNINNLLNREESEKNFIECLEYFEKNKQKITNKKEEFIFMELLDQVKPDLLLIY